MLKQDKAPDPTLVSEWLERLKTMHMKLASALEELLHQLKAA